MIDLDVDFETDEVIGLDELCEWSRRNLRPGDLDALLSGATRLRALANDPRFLADWIAARIRRILDGGPPDVLAPTGPSFLLGFGEGWKLRANLWAPLSSNSARRDLQQRMAFYEIAHDHTYPFLTVGYHGPGYETDRFEVDCEAEPAMGERVRLERRGRHRLHRGRVMCYRPRRDAHVQHPPESLSISLALMVEDPAWSLRPARFFDVRAETFAGNFAPEAEQRRLLVELCGAICGEEALGPLDQLAERHPDPKLAAAACSARETISGRTQG